MRSPFPPPAWRGHAAVITLAAVLGTLFVVDEVTENPRLLSGGKLATELLVGGAACGALLVRRRWAATLALLLVPSLTLATSAMGPTAVAMLALAVHRPWRVTATVLGVHAVTLAVLFGLVAEHPREFWQALLFVLALDAALVTLGLLVRSQRLLVQSLRQRAQQAEQSHQLRVQEARHTERERIAREMHNVLAHRVRLLAVEADALTVRPSAAPEQRHAVAVVRECAHEALQDLREVIDMLRADPAGGQEVRQQPTLDDLPALIEQSRRAGAQVSLDCTVAGLTAAAPGTGRHVYRIVEEGLTNARKHAPHAAVTVRLRPGTAPVAAGDGEHAGGLVVEITNPVPPGSGQGGIPGAGSGLIGLRERVDLAGGRLEHGRTPDGGFRLYAWLPSRP